MGETEIAKYRKQLALLKARSAKTDEKTQLLKEEAATSVQHAERVKQQFLATS